MDGSTVSPELLFSVPTTRVGTTTLFRLKHCLGCLCLLRGRLPCVRASSGSSRGDVVVIMGPCVQVIDVDAAIGALPGEPCALSGLAFTPSGRRLFVGVEGSEMDTGPHGILAFDAQMLSRTTFGAAQLA